MKQKIKICFLVSSLANEGPVNVLYNIVRYMDPQTYDMAVLTLIPEKKSSRLNDFEKLPLRIIPIEGRGLFKPLNLYQKFKKV